MIYQYISNSHIFWWDIKIYRSKFCNISIYDIIKYINYNNIMIYRDISHFLRYILIYLRYIAIYRDIFFSFLRYITRYIWDISQKWPQYIAICQDISWYIAIYHDISRYILTYRLIYRNFAIFAVTNSHFQQKYCFSAINIDFHDFLNSFE